MIKILGIAVFGLLGVAIIVMGFMKSDTTMIGMGFFALGIPVLIVLASTVFRKHFDTEESGAFGLQVLGVMVGGKPPRGGKRLDLLHAELAYLISTGDYNGAVKAGQQALKVAEELSGPDHPDVARSLDKLGAAHIALKQYPQAELLGKRALAILQKALGPNHPEVATLLENMAQLYRKMDGRRVEAQALAKMAARIRGVAH